MDPPDRLDCDLQVDLNLTTKDMTGVTKLQQPCFMCNVNSGLSENLFVVN